MSGKKRDDIMTDIYQKAEVSIEELRSKVNDLAALKELFKDLSSQQTSSTIQKFKDTEIGDVLQEAGNLGTKMKDMHTALDQLKKVSKDIEVTQKGTNASYEDTLKILKDIYQTKKKSKDLTDETKRALEGQISALKLHEAQYKKLHDQKRKQFEEERSWTHQLTEVVQRKFGANFGSSTLGSALGRPQGGAMGSIFAHLGAQSGFAGAMHDNSFVRMIAKGFDASDKTDRLVKHAEGTTKALHNANEVGSAQSSRAGAIAAGAALAVLGGGAAGRYVGGKGLEGANWAVQSIKGFSDPGGLDKLLYGQIGGKLAGALFGAKAGSAVTGMAGTLLDALTYTHKMGLDSTLASAGIRAQNRGVGGINLESVAGSTGFASGEARGVVDYYTRQGVNMMGGKGVNDNIRYYGRGERLMGADVMQSGVKSAFAGLDDSNQAALKLYSTFSNLRSMTNSIGFSVQEMTKQISTAAVNARFLQWDFSVISKLSTDILSGGGQTELIKLGLDPKNNMAGIIGGMTGIRKAPLATELFHSRNMGFNNIDDAIQGATFGVGPGDVGKIHYDADGFAVNTMSLNEQVTAGSKYNRGLLHSAQRTLLGLDSKAKNFVQRDDTFAKQIGLGSAETARLLLNSKTGRSIEKMTDEEVEKLVKSLQSSNKTSENYLADIAKYSESSAAFTEKFQTATMRLLASILNSIFLLPGYIGAVLTRDTAAITAYDKAYAQLGGRADASMKTIMKGSAEMKEGFIWVNSEKGKEVNLIPLKDGAAGSMTKNQAIGIGELRGGRKIDVNNIPGNDLDNATSSAIIEGSTKSDKEVLKNKKGKSEGINYNFYISNSFVDLDKIKSVLGSVYASEIS